MLPGKLINVVLTDDAVLKVVPIHRIVNGATSSSRIFLLRHHQRFIIVPSANLGTRKVHYMTVFSANVMPPILSKIFSPIQGKVIV